GPRSRVQRPHPVYSVFPEDSTARTHLGRDTSDYLDLVLEIVSDGDAALGRPAVVARALRVDDPNDPVAVECRPCDEADQPALATAGRPHNEQVRRVGRDPPSDATARLRAQDEPPRPGGAARFIEAMRRALYRGILPFR